jgi:hypothetical protein
MVPQASCSAPRCPSPWCLGPRPSACAAAAPPAEGEARAAPPPPPPRRAAPRLQKVLQEEVRRSLRHSQDSPHQREINVDTSCALGRGGYGTVYRGTWQKAAAAIKVVHTKRDEHEVRPNGVWPGSDHGITGV